MDRQCKRTFSNLATLTKHTVRTPQELRVELLQRIQRNWFLVFRRDK